MWSETKTNLVLSCAKSILSPSKLSPSDIRNLCQSLSRIFGMEFKAFCDSADKVKGSSQTTFIATSLLNKITDCQNREKLFSCRIKPSAAETLMAFMMRNFAQISVYLKKRKYVWYAIYLRNLTWILVLICDHSIIRVFVQTVRCCQPYNKNNVL